MGSRSNQCCVDRLVRPSTPRNQRLAVLPAEARSDHPGDPPTTIFPAEYPSLAFLTRQDPQVTGQRRGPSVENAIGKNIPGHCFTDVSDNQPGAALSMVGLPSHDRQLRCASAVPCCAPLSSCFLQRVGASPRVFRRRGSSRGGLLSCSRTALRRVRHPSGGVHGMVSPSCCLFVRLNSALPLSPHQDQIDYAEKQGDPNRCPSRVHT